MNSYLCGCCISKIMSRAKGLMAKMKQFLVRSFAYGQNRTGVWIQDGNNLLLEQKDMDMENC